MGFWTKNKSLPQQSQESQVTNLPIIDNEVEYQSSVIPPQSEYPVIENDEDLEKIEKSQQINDRAQEKIIQKQSIPFPSTAIDVDEEEILLEKLKKIQDEKERKRLEEERKLEEQKNKEYIDFNQNNTSSSYSQPIYLNDAECLRMILQQNYDIQQKLDFLLDGMNKIVLKNG